MKIVVGITGATGAILGIRILELLKKASVETHLVMSSWAHATIKLETPYSVQQVEALADYCYSYQDQAAKISSGSFRIDGMIVSPCSMKTLASIRMGLADNLIARTADVMLKERKPLVLLPRETPLNTIHLENMLDLSKMGAILVPPMPAFYNKPETIEDIVTHIAVRTLDQLGIELPEAKRWNGIKHLSQGGK
ncbi:non-oxidative hydroxyarylic acid decarboxylases subunit B [Priestia aryabhattai]|uniref:non-oxidative hydroxyarylic acid decarboxylases subunit B n=1 Tax=Priestia aryabhattai TaxID=412384 RepID=UPI0008DCE936|nr:non-oxidative hydroxyarylic acid decarboxylases subunit B [Priestia aryabhattai]MBX9966974.1 UbiX family flavin prenyltransferase [Priestia aryabhattai]MBZ6487524.1 UbiX family flavin prenyltransferase [Priestia aryabhattai]MDH3114382.1 non-oxidative hydroxyarylic acid decarboxylases subunit B [Priestia aryabhattai]MDH3126720.1 non-oxidative hydroxyarylic acid decarboxylases subunit B [Priestia aryabhattai]MDH3133036.1 non-oxidative hydroxyarylic acid decarboxylases subunit B [Priestia arya